MPPGRVQDPGPASARRRGLERGAKAITLSRRAADDDSPAAGPRLRGRPYHHVRFWVGADGRVTRVEVDPLLSDDAYRREFLERMLALPVRPRLHARRAERRKRLYRHFTT